MTPRSIEHDSFTLERYYEAAPAEVFAAWADPAAKARWFRGPQEWEAAPHELDFRVGGRELSRGGPPGGPVHTYSAIYWDIVPIQRIVYTYELLMDETRISVSLTTIELKAERDLTRLVLTEHGAFFDGRDSAAQRRQGTGSLLEELSRELQHDPATG